jgi:hypothetical protein
MLDTQTRLRNAIAAVGGIPPNDAATAKSEQSPV